MTITARSEPVVTRSAKDEILALARAHGVGYRPSSRDAWAEQVTRLAGDEVRLDDTELLLIALQRGGHISRPVALGLQAQYLREIRL